MTFKVTPAGTRNEAFSSGTYEVFKIEHLPFEGEMWPVGPVFPEGHILTLQDGKRYEITIPETVQRRRSAIQGDVDYVHRYICRYADEKDA